MKLSHTQARSRARDTLLEKSILVTVVGVAFLVSPTLLKGSTAISAVAAGLQPAGWVALGLGFALLGLHLLLQHRHTAPPEPDTAESRFQQSILNYAEPPEFLQSTPPRPPRPMAAPAREPQRSWRPEVFAQIEWRRFEAVCEALFSQAGFQTQAQSHGADGGVDIWLHSRHAQGPVAVVQCKHWPNKPVGVKEMREFLGVMTARKLKRGTYATSGRYSREALQFARDNGINALDGAALIQLILKRTPEQQQQLLAVAYEGEYWRPTCASCGIKLVERKNEKTGQTFWGCSNFPRCRTLMHKATTG
jgi:restriction system protein